MDTAAVVKVLRRLEKEVQKFRVPTMDLHETHNDEPFRILLATIMSARTKDEVTAVASRKLFKKVKNFKDIREISEAELRKIIHPVGFYKTKAKHIKQLPEVIDKEFDGKIRETIDELVKLPGVGRKTANLVVSLAFKEDAVCVDTHVHRIMNRFGYVRTKTPHETEMRLRAKLPRNWWRVTNRILVAYGQNTCTPLSPWCSKCPVAKLCEQKNVKRTR
ncbi:endonuclease III [Candidatus Woesearchaeota archaeon]|nr:endonuclease III [Candidatus Woesearchaeota archaeon]